MQKFTSSNKEIEYDTDYPKEPISRDNPYYRCTYCKRSDPKINGRLEGHAKYCKYRVEKELAIAKEILQENERLSKGWW